MNIQSEGLVVTTSFAFASQVFYHPVSFPPSCLDGLLVAAPLADKSFGGIELGFVSLSTLAFEWEFSLLDLPVWPSTRLQVVLPEPVSDVCLTCPEPLSDLSDRKPLGNQCFQVFSLHERDIGL